MWRQDFNIQSVQRRLSRMRGERQSNEENIELEAKIKQLYADLEEKQNTSSRLNEQIKRVNVRLISQIRVYTV